MDWVRKGNSLKKLSYKLHSKAGRNNTGKITVRHRGGGEKRFFRVIDQWRSLWNVPALVVSLESTCFSYFVATLIYPIGVLAQIAAPHGLQIGDVVMAGWKTNAKQVGNCMPLLNIPLNIKIHNIESYPGSGAVFCRAAGTWARVAEASANSVVVILRSGAKKVLSPFCLATVGRVSNTTYRNKKFYKAGQVRRAGIRPTVRGVAMNPVDHPHGGGKGKKSKNSVPQSPWGRLGKGQKTVNKK